MCIHFISFYKIYIKYRERKKILFTESICICVFVICLSVCLFASVFAEYIKFTFTTKLQLIQCVHMNYIGVAAEKVLLFSISFDF